jgi:hypothetical protein
METEPKEFSLCEVLRSKSLERFFTDVLDLYQETLMRFECDFSQDCLLTLLKDFDICPRMVSIKEAFIIYSVVFSGNSEFKRIQLR